MSTTRRGWLLGVLVCVCCWVTNVILAPEHLGDSTRRQPAVQLDRVAAGTYPNGGHARLLKQMNRRP